LYNRTNMVEMLTLLLRENKKKNVNTVRRNQYQKVRALY
jgi:hypothetical protein